MKKYFIVFLFSFCLYQAPRTEAGAVSPAAAGAFALVPGLGHVVNGNVLEGLAWFVVPLGLWLTPNYYMQIIGFQLWFYNIYDAYRVAGAPEAPKINVFQNYIGNFNPLNVIDPVSAFAIGINIYAKEPHNSVIGPKEKYLTPLFFSFIGMGEEGMFRGFLFPMLSRGMGNTFLAKVGAATISSAAFAAYHLINRTEWDRKPEALGWRFAMGMLWCLEASYNNFDLRKNIFGHTWGDTVIDWKGGGYKASIVPAFATERGTELDGMQFRLKIPF